MDVGQGDAILVRLPNKQTLLIDGGQRFGSKDYGELVIKPMLKYFNMNLIVINDFIKNEQIRKLTPSPRMRLGGERSGHNWRWINGKNINYFKSETLCMEIKRVKNLESNSSLKIDSQNIEIAIKRL